MRINTVRIENYKSFRESSIIKIEPGFNIIVGRNNVGKTALVEACSMRFENKPHRSLLTAPRPNTQLSPESKVEISYVLEKGELSDLITDNLSQFFVPRIAGRSVKDHWEEFQAVIQNRHELSSTYRPGDIIYAELEFFRAIPDTGTGVSLFVDRPSFQIQLREEGFVNVERKQTLAYPLARLLRERIYFFNAERLTVGESRFGSNRILAPNAGNLAEVLNILQSDRVKFARLNSYVSSIFPDIKEIMVEPKDNNVRIRVSGLEAERERIDLAVPLSECGTGVGQVLAMLYVAMDSAYSRVIVIDEPQSFLHPGAIRRLFEILQEYPNNQYIVTTHSPSAITAAEPRSLIMVRKEDFESKIELINFADVTKLRLYLAEVGARLSDVFGADSVLWVEGQTEEQCFPNIIANLLNLPLLGTAVIGVLHADELRGKDAKKVYELYERLSQGSGLLPSALGFIFDREKLTDTEVADLKRRSRNVVHFTPRRMYENYLLNLNAISYLINSIQGFSNNPVTLEALKDWLDTNKWNREFYDSPLVSESDRTDNYWIHKVDGAKLLDKMFNHFSETRANYKDGKVEYGLALTTWLIDNAPQDLAEIASLIKEVLDQRTVS